MTLRDRDTFAVVDRISVTSKGDPVRGLNELECVGDSVYANVYQTDRIVRIQKATGKVTAVIDASGLLTPIERLGFKGRRLGGALVSPRHANFIVNAGGATAADVLQLIRQIREAVESATGFRMEAEAFYVTPLGDIHPAGEEPEPQA